MNIAVDMQPLLTDSKKRGMGIYVRGLLEEIFKQDTQNKYYLLNLYGQWEYEPDSLPKNVFYTPLYMGKDNCLLVKKHYNLDAYEEKHKELIGAVYRRFIRKNKIDVFIIPAPFDVYSCYEKEWFDETTTVMVVHDLIPLIFKDQYLAKKGTLKWYMGILQCVRSSDLLLANSMDTKNSFVECAGVEAGRVEVIYAGVPKEYMKKYDRTAMDELKSAYGICGDFLFMPGADDPRKNVERTIRAYAKLPDGYKETYQLVITGGMQKHFLYEMDQIVKELSLGRRVVFTGYVTTEKMAMLYNLTSLMVFPSQYEGFGLPVMEAFACGAPVVTSNCGSLKEVAEGAALLVDPFDTDDIARGIKEALDNYPLEAFAPLVKERLCAFTWENVVKRALAAIRALPAHRVVPVKHRIAVFTSFKLGDKAAEQRNIENIKSLLRYCDVDVYTQSADGSIPAAPLGDFYAKAGAYDEYLYQISDDESCLFMLDIMEQYKGVIDLNDDSYHQMIYRGLLGNEVNWSDYGRYLQYEVIDADGFIKSAKKDPDLLKEGAAKINLCRFLADRAKKMIVHSERAREILLSKNIGYVIKTLEGSLNGDRRYYDAVFEQDGATITEGTLVDLYFSLKEQGCNTKTEFKKLAETMGYLLREDGTDH